MNELNNGENNNQNIEQPNLNENQNMVQPEQQYVQPERPVSEPPKNEEKKSYCGLLIVFMIISLLLAGFIVYDKVIKREEPVKPIDNNEQENGKTNEEQTNTSESDKKYFEVKSISKVINNKKYDIDFSFYVAPGNFGDVVYCDMVVNSKIVEQKSIYNVSYDVYDGSCKNKSDYNFNYLYGKVQMNSCMKNADEYIKYQVDNIVNNFKVGTIKDENIDVEYFYLLENDTFLWILDEKVNVLTKHEVNYADVKEENYMSIGGVDCDNLLHDSKGCENERFSKKQDGSIYPIYFGEDGIYFFATNEEDYDTVEDYDNFPVSEYKLSVNNGILKKTKINQCHAKVTDGVC